MQINSLGLDTDLCFILINTAEVMALPESIGVDKAGI